MRPRPAIGRIWAGLSFRTGPPCVAWRTALPPAAAGIAPVCRRGRRIPPRRGHHAARRALRSSGALPPGFRHERSGLRRGPDLCGTFAGGRGAGGLLGPGWPGVPPWGVSPTFWPGWACPTIGPCTAVLWSVIHVTVIGVLPPVWPPGWSGCKGNAHGESLSGFPTREHGMDTRREHDFLGANGRYRRTRITVFRPAGRWIIST